MMWSLNRDYWDQYNNPQLFSKGNFTTNIAQPFNDLTPTTPTISNVQAPTTTPVRGWAHAEFSWYVSGVSKDPASDSSLVIT